MLPPDRPDATVSVREQLGGVGEVIRRPAVLVILVGGAASFVMIFGVFLSTLPIHLENEFGYGASVRGLFLALPAVSSTLVAFNLQRVRERMSARRAAGHLLARVRRRLRTDRCRARRWRSSSLGCIVYGVGEGALIPTLQDQAVELSPPEHRGAVVAVYVGAARLGQTIGPLGAAALFGATSTFVALEVGVGAWRVGARRRCSAGSAPRRHARPDPSDERTTDVGALRPIAIEWLSCRRGWGRGAVRLPRSSSPCARRSRGELVALDLADAEVLGLGVGEVEAGHRRAGPHRERLGQLDADGVRRVEQVEQRGFSVWSGWLG